MKKILFAVILLMTISNVAAKESPWKWVGARSSTDRWDIYEGEASVVISGGKIEIILYDSSDGSIYSTISGRISKNIVMARMIIHDTDIEPAGVHGTYKNQIWSRVDMSGREVIILGDGFDVYGITREIHGRDAK